MSNINWNTLYERSYTRYSGVPDAVVVAGESGQLYPGVRIENIAFPDTIPAEQAAIFSCLSAGAKPLRLYINEEKRSPGPFLDYWCTRFHLEIRVQQDIPDLPVYQPLLFKKRTIEKALDDLLKKAVVPYSHSPVSAILEVKEGIIGGVNIECVDWRLGLCAERVAIAKALSHGITDFSALHIFSRSGNFCSPCGACRQVILEHLPDVPVYLHHPDGSRSVYRSRDFLPYAFAPFPSSLSKKR